MIILVTGSREWPDNELGKSLIRIALIDVMKRKYWPEKIKRSEILVVHGNARGADKLAASVCDDLRVRHTGELYG